MKHPSPLVLLAMAACALAFAAPAQGQVAYAARNVNLRAGPARDYPVVAIVPVGYQIAVQGCVPDYTWCDVLAGPNRGWIYAGNINYAYQNTYVPVLNYGAVLGIGVLAFVLDDYWGHYYADRPWYGQRHRWANRPAPRYRPPRRDFPGSQRPDVIGPRPAQPPRSMVPRPQRPNPSGGVLPGQRPAPQPRIGPAPQPQPGVAPRARPQQGVGPGAARPARPQREGAPRRGPPGEGRGRGPDQHGQ